MTTQEIDAVFGKHGSKSAKNNHRIAIYVPTRTKAAAEVAARNVTAKKLRKATIAFMVDRFYGCSVIKITGFYKEDGCYTDEKVRVIYSFTSAQKLAEHADEIIRMANAICIEYRQSSVAVEIDSQMFFYEPTQAYRDEYDRLLLRAAKDPEKSFGYQKYVNKNLPLDNKSKKV